MQKHSPAHKKLQKFIALTLLLLYDYCQTTEKLEGLVDFDDDPAETKTESEPEEVMVDDDLIINDPFADEDDLLGEEKTETKGSEKEVLGDQVEAAMERLVSDTNFSRSHGALSYGFGPLK